MIILVNVEKVLDEIHYLLNIKTLNNLGREVNCLTRCARYRETRVNIVLIGEMLKAFPLNMRLGQGCPLSTHLFNTVLYVLASSTSK